MINQTLDKVQELITNHREKIDFILDDYMIGGNAAIEAMVKSETELDKLLIGLRINSKATPFDEAMEALEACDDDDLKVDEILDFVHDKIDGDAMLDYMNAKGYAFVKLDSLKDKEKLEEFVKAEIWPFYNDSDKYSI
jgi:hypothetical protein